MNRAAEIEAQAAAWIARCDAQATGDQNPELIAWLCADPRHRAAYLRLAEAWRRSERLERLRPTGSLLDPDLLAPPPKARFRRFGDDEPTRVASRPRWRALGWACAAVLLIASGWALWSNLESPGVRIYRTGVAGLSRVVLSDGSQMTLNSDTEVRVRFTAATRTVMLTRGEAEFAVTHDVQRPFEVEASNHVVIDVGTAFDVRLDGNHDIEITVTEGRVALVQPGLGGPKLVTIPPPIIRAGESALATASQVTIQQMPPAQVSRRLAWEHRELSFQGQSLDDAVAEFNRYNGHRLIIDDSSLGSLSIGGNFEALDVASFVAALGRSFAISARTASDGTIHLFRPASQPQNSPVPP